MVVIARQVVNVCLLACDVQSLELGGSSYAAVNPTARGHLEF